MVRIPWFLLLFATLALGCPSSVVGDDDDTHDGSGNGQDDDDDDSQNEPPETDCTDGSDNDHDGLVDCMDDDCAAELVCTWPNEMDHQGRFDFISESAFVDDCEVRLESLLVKMTSGGCPDCDRTFEGQYQYSSNTCQDLFDAAGMDLPAEGMYGLNFLSHYERDVYTLNTDSGAWDFIGQAIYLDQLDHYMIERQEDLEWESIPVGTLFIELTFADR